MSARLLIPVLVMAAAMAPASSADTIVVNWAGGDDFMFIQDGIDYASEGDTVLVMPGIYEGPGNTYIGFGGTNLVLKSTGGARSTVIDGQGLTHCFFFCGLESAASVVEGFTIINGSAVEGAGMRLVGSSPTIRNCVFNRNISTGRGGGIYCETGANPTLIDCTFSNNSAAWSGGAVYMEYSSPSFTDCSFDGNRGSDAWSNGGAVFCRDLGAPVFTDCSFTNNIALGSGGAVVTFSGTACSFINCGFVGNAATWDGGAVYVYEDLDTSFDNCWFYDNTAGYDGGAVKLEDNAVQTFTDCTFAGNAASDEGGAIYCYNYATPTLTGCTLYDNSAPYGSGIWCDDNFNLTNSIIAFGVVGAAVHCDGDPPYIACSDIYGNAGGDWVGCLAGMDVTDNNIHADPLFCDALSGDFTLDIPSPCTAANAPSCGLVGAWDIGCDSPVQAESWGAIKTMYR